MEILTTILSNTFTKPDLIRRMRLIRLYLEKKFFTGSTLSLTEFLSSTEASGPDITAIKEWGDIFISIFTPSNMYPLLHKAKEDAKKLPVITLYLPLDPDERETERIGKWFRKKVSPDILLDLKSDRDKIVGCSFANKGKFHNFSLKYFLDKHKSDIMDILDNWENNQEEKQGSGIRIQDSA